ncbi:DUF1499 domain-containing protein [Microvirga lenta]|uniref:DUF1499 domain-containing protein n=1 Tax=Microvirga lenta TaxID=2881337 RepID=UPI001CFD7E2A|nr:DUF1499 domain-containing protein [Microvirga lenta]MCB5173752.1 DUF1499 domain-containing protein [Microvirga lenta]
MKKSKALKVGLAGAGLGYGLWRIWETGIEAVWQRAFGAPDLGPADFATLRRRRTPNDCLACPRDFCPGAESDFEPPVFPVSSERLRAIVRDVASREHGTQLVESTSGQDRYLVRTRLMRFPDTVDVKVVDLGDDRSTVALYSRSQIGRSDLGANGKRLRRWIERISTSVEAERRGSGP